MKQFYQLLFILSLFAIDVSRAQSPARPQPQPQKQATNSQSQTTKPKQTPATDTKTQPAKQSQKQAGTRVDPQSAKQTQTQSGKNTQKQSADQATVTVEAAEVLRPSTVDDTVGVVLHADPRLAMLTYNTKHEGQITGGRRTGSIYSGRGFRVQIYSGNDRNVATQRKIDFIRRFPGIRTYMTYIAPTFRVKVGDYRDRKAAQVMYQQTSKYYNPCMIVNDIIEINTFRND